MVEKEVEKKWYTDLNKSSLTPPSYVFGIVDQYYIYYL